MKKYRIFTILAAAFAVFSAMLMISTFTTDKPQAVKAAETVEAADTFTLYDVPLDASLQLHIARTCEKHHIDPAIVLAMIDQESDFNPDAVGDNGNSLGLMQIQPRWHLERISKLGCTDLMNPYENITVAVDYLAEMKDKYDGNIEKALVAYNAGSTGAYKHYFSKGVYSSEYSRAVLETAAALKGGA